MPESPGIFEQIFVRESVSSILGLLITVWILLNLHGIRKDFLFRARIPQLIRKLKEHSSRLNKHLQDFSGSGQMIDLELGKCRANLRSLRSKLPRNSKRSVKKLEKQIQKNTPTKSESSKDKIWEIYTDLNSLIEEMKNLEQDKQWERSI